MLFSILFGAATVAAVPTIVERDGSSVQVNKEVPEGAGEAILQPFVSFSIEFSSFPDFAGMYQQPGTWVLLPLSMVQALT